MMEKKTDSREAILARIRRNTQRVYERPDLSALEQAAIHYDDRVEQFRKVMHQMGGRAVLVQPGDDLNELIRQQYPDARRVASALDRVEVCGREQALTCPTFHPDSVARSRDLDGTDLAIVRGSWGVCENGAVWIVADVEQRAVYFIAEALAIVLDRNCLVDNMHEAYRRIDTGAYGFGVFISGPSKTADIEQALVFGAHGAADVTVFLV